MSEASRAQAREEVAKALAANNWRENDSIPIWDDQSDAYREAWRTDADHVLDFLDFDRLSGLLGYVKADEASRLIKGAVEMLDSTARMLVRLKMDTPEDQEITDGVIARLNEYGDALLVAIHDREVVTDAG